MMWLTNSIEAPPCPSSGQESPTAPAPISKESVNVTCISGYSFADGTAVKTLSCSARMNWDGSIRSFWAKVNQYGYYETSEEKCIGIEFSFVI